MGAVVVVVGLVTCGSGRWVEQGVGVGGGDDGDVAVALDDDDGLVHENMSLGQKFRRLVYPQLELLMFQSE